jgi:hypothetical protein
MRSVRIRNAATSLEYCSRVCGASSSKLTWPDCNGGGIAATCRRLPDGTPDYSTPRYRSSYPSARETQTPARYRQRVNADNMTYERRQGDGVIAFRKNQREVKQ